MSTPETVIYLDAENIFYSLYNAFPNHRINITKFIFYLQEKFGDFNLYAFGHFARIRGLPLFIRRDLDNFPFVYVFETKMDDDGDVIINEADHAMLQAMMFKNIGIMANAKTYKHVVIMSGDGFFFQAALTAHLSKMKVTIAASCHNTVKHTYENADANIIYLEDDMHLFHTLAQNANPPPNPTETTVSPNALPLKMATGAVKPQEY